MTPLRHPVSRVGASFRGCPCPVGAQHAAPHLGVASTRRTWHTFGAFLLASSLAATSLLADCKCHHPEKGDSTRPGANMYIVQQEEKPYRELKGTVELDSDRPLEDVLVEIFDQPEYLLKQFGPPPDGQKRLAACVTSENGKFCFHHLPPGKYELRASSQAGVNVTHVYVVVDKKGQTKQIPVRMTLGT